MIDYFNRLDETTTEAAKEDALSMILDCMNNDCDDEPPADFFYEYNLNNRKEMRIFLVDYLPKNERIGRHGDQYLKK